MNEHKDEKWLDEIISRSVDSGKLEFDAEKWKQKYPEETKMLSELAGQRSQTISDREQNIWRTIMKSRITKFAAAAVIIIGVITGMTFMGGPDMASVAWAEVAERVEQVQTFTYRMKMSMEGSMMPEMPDISQEMESVTIGSIEYGMKMETISEGKIAQQMFILPKEKIAITIMPAMKKYMQMEFDEEYVTEMKKNNPDPRELVKEFMKCEYAELGRDVIDGIEVEGIEVTDPRFYGGMFNSVIARMWVDVEEGWPVLMEMDVTMNDGRMKMHMVTDDYQWDIDVDPSEFEPVIPDDYTALPSMKLPKMNAEVAIEGLKKFVELTGRYPEKLNPTTLMQEILKAKSEKEKQTDKPSIKDIAQSIEDLRQDIVTVEVLPEKFSPEKAKELIERNKKALEYNEEVMEKINKHMEEVKTQMQTYREEFDKPDADAWMNEFMEKFMPVQMLGMFHAKLIQEDKDPVYYGNSLEPGDADSILLRWKADEGGYNVIYGDLTVETVSADRLAQMEEAFTQ